MEPDDILTYASITLAPAITSLVGLLVLRAVHRESMSVRASCVLFVVAAAVGTLLSFWTNGYLFQSPAWRRCAGCRFCATGRSGTYGSCCSDRWCRFSSYHVGAARSKGRCLSLILDDEPDEPAKSLHRHRGYQDHRRREQSVPLIRASAVTRSSDPARDTAGVIVR
jgi:hypothetical protein